MSICILCIIAVLLYAIICLIEKWYLKKDGDDSIDLSSRLFHNSKLPVGPVTRICKCCITVLLLLSSESP